MNEPIELDLNTGWDWLARRPNKAWLCGEDTYREDEVDLPHCWNRTDTFQIGVAYHRGDGGYRRSISIPSSVGEREDIRLQFETEGFYGLGELWIDGERIKRFDGEYLGCSIDVTDSLQPGRDHLVSIRLTNRCPRHVLPGIRMPDFVLFGGLAGRCKLRTRPDFHIDAEGVFVTAEMLDKEAYRLNVRYELTNISGRERSCYVQCTIVTPDGAICGEVQSESICVQDGKRNHCGNLDCRVFNPMCWDVDHPDLHTATLRVFEAGNVHDHQTVRFGIRDARFHGDRGFFLNGRRVDLHGCNRHEAIPGLGNAMTPELHRRDAELLKEFGCNFVRLSHYPQHPAFLDACDELGILVYAEIATWKSVRSGRWLRNACRQMRRMIRRDRNHPSVILWGLGNESRERKPYLALTEVVRECDPTRQTIYAENHIYRGRRKRTLDLPDVFGVNYEIKLLDEARSVSRNGSVLISECASWRTRRGELSAEISQIEHIQETWDAIGSRSFVAGFVVWCFVDYATLRKQRYTRYSGIVDAWRLPKMAAWLMKAKYSREPFIQLFGEWGMEGRESRNVLVFTNCSSVVLQTEEGAMTLSNMPWYRIQLPFSGKPIVADAVEVPSVRAELRPWSSACKLLIGPECQCLNGGEIIGVRIMAVDAQGECDRGYFGHIKFRAEGAKDVYFYRPDGTVLLSAGEGRVYVRITEPGVTVLFRAEAEGLESDEVSLRWLGAESMTKSEATDFG